MHNQKTHRDQISEILKSVSNYGLFYFGVFHVDLELIPLPSTPLSPEVEQPDAKGDPKVFGLFHYSFLNFP